MVGQSIVGIWVNLTSARTSRRALHCKRRLVAADRKLSRLNIQSAPTVAGVPAKVMRTLTTAEITRKHQGTLMYQELARRCHASMVEVLPLTEPQDNRHRLRVAVPMPPDSDPQP